MTTSRKRVFLLTVVFQSLHSVEEYLFEVWNYLEPARLLSGLVSDNLQYGFIIINSAIVLLMFASFLFFVRQTDEAARPLIWFWAVLETLNGIAHIAFGIETRGYFPGLYTAPFLLLLGSTLIWQLTVTREAA